MSQITEYILRASLSLTLVYLFYQFVLRRLTFYSLNRMYFLLYTGISLVIPLVNIMPALEKNNLNANKIVTAIPILDIGLNKSSIVNNVQVASASNFINAWDFVVIILVAGIVFFLLRFLIRIVSFGKMRSKARLISGGEINIYEVDDNIAPFSFGKSIFLNSSSHSVAELKEIMRHEFVHVKQLHSGDILWAEILCIFNWYNPFIWLLRNSIRQNLEFIADDKVLKAGIDKKQYQYLLLKVIGNNQFSIANNFNFSSLKKRIAMMNKLKTHKIHLLRMLLLLPATALLLLAFRQKIESDKKNISRHNIVQIAGLVLDIKTKLPISRARIVCEEINLVAVTDAKGYFIFETKRNNDLAKFKLLIQKEGYVSLSDQQEWSSLENKSIAYFAIAKKSEAHDTFSMFVNPGNSSNLNYDLVVQTIGRVVISDSALNFRGELFLPAKANLLVDTVEKSGYLGYETRDSSLQIALSDQNDHSRIAFSTSDSVNMKYEAMNAAIPEKFVVEQPKGNVKEPSFLSKKALVEQDIWIVADTVFWNASQKDGFRLIGDAVFIDSLGGTTVTGSLIKLEQKVDMLVMDDEKYRNSPVFIVTNKRKYRVTILSKADAMLKYGSSVNGEVMELNSK